MQRIVTGGRGCYVEPPANPCVSRENSRKTTVVVACLHDDGSVSMSSEFISSYFEEEGRENFKNPGLQTITKAILNSLWGKLIQNENNTSVCFIQDYEDLLVLSYNEQYIMTLLDFVTKDCLRVTLT